MNCLVHNRRLLTSAVFLLGIMQTQSKAAPAQQPPNSQLIEEYRRAQIAVI
jgi:hypothetical protein